MLFIKYSHPNCSFFHIAVMKIVVLVLFLKILLPSVVFGQCTEERNQDFDITWPETQSGQYASSLPLCINSKREIQRRYCNGSQWEPELSCGSIQKTSHCPDGLTYSKQLDICYTKQTSKYPLRCPFADLDVPFEKYAEILQGDGGYWMPIRRNSTNGYGFLEWTEKSVRYKQIFTDERFIDGNKVLENDCVLYFNDSFKLALPCKEEHDGICAYSNIELVDHSPCNSQFCRRSSYDLKSPCFCRGKGNSSNYKKIEILHSYQNFIATSIAEDDCAIGLEKINDNYLWIYSKTEINYTCWEEGTIFDNLHTFGAISSSGWFLMNEEEKTELNCFLYEQNLRETASYLDLQYSNTFKLTIFNASGFKKFNSGKVMVFCFTDATKLDLIYKYPTFASESINGENVVYTFHPSTIGPGHYWCEAFKYPNVEVVASNTILLRPEKFDFEFVGIFEIGYIKGSNPLTPDIIDSYLERIFFLRLEEDDHLGKYYTGRIMKISNVDEHNNIMTINVHFTSTVQENSLEITVELHRVKELIISVFATLSSFKIKLIDFKSSDFCGKETTQVQRVTLNWPTTHKDVSSFPEEYCFKDSIRYSRTCIGNFVDGFQFEKIEPCYLLEPSAITDSLLQLQWRRSAISSSLVEITENHSEFKPLDVYLVSEILGEIAKIPLADLTVIVNNLLKIHPTVLWQSQILTNSTNRILLEIDRLVLSSDENFEKWSLENFILISSDFHENCFIGILITQSNVRPLYCGEDVKVLIEQDVVGEAVAINSSKEGLAEFRVIFMVYLKPFLFNEELEIHKVTTSFRVIFPTPDHSDSVQVFRKINNRNEMANCQQWRLAQSRWETVRKGDELSNFFLCNFEEQAHLTIGPAKKPFDDVSNSVTDNLLDLLTSEETTAVIVETLHNVSNRYEEFESNDVNYVGKILEKISSDSEVDLKILADIISNLHEIGKDVLYESQSRNGSTDAILYYVDEIIRNHKYLGHIEVESKNLKIVKSDVKETNISGLFLEASNGSLIMNTVFGDYNEEEIHDNERIEGAIFLSRELKSQLVNDSQVSFTVFTNSSLFNQDSSNYSYVSKIFGILLPKLEEQDGPIAVVHKVTERNDFAYCVYWKYDVLSSLIGMWSPNHNMQVYNQWTKCQFWHTTHFALLIISRDDTPNDSEILDIITLTNCSFSLLGLFMIALTAVLFKNWRRNTGNQILLNFDFAIALQIVSFLVSGTYHEKLKNDLLWCTVTGIVLHYSLISQFCWMFTIAILQFKRFVEVLGGPPKYVLLKACLCGWVLPILPVVGVYLSDPENYVSGMAGLCYPSDLGLYLGVWLPILIIVAINLVIFMYIMYNICHKKTECCEAGNNDILFQWRLAILLFFMLGLSWTFGFLCELDFGWIFLYLFCFTASAQGFIMFLFFILFNKNTRHLYSERIKKLYLGEKYY